MGKRDFGSVRKRTNGRWQVRYVDPCGRKHSKMFATRGDASRFPSRVRADMDRGDWADPDAGQAHLREYAENWLALRRVRGKPLAPRTRERYDSCLRLHILPTLGDLQLRHIDVPAVRRWYADQLRSGLSSASVAKNYRLLHAILATATVDEEITRNPCNIPGASAESSDERPIATLPQVMELAAAVGTRYRALVLLATFCGLRFGELAGLTRDRLDLDNAFVAVTVDLDELDSGVLQPGEVKSRAGRRTVSIPSAIMPDLQDHLAEHAEPGPQGFVFVGSQGGQLRRSNFRSQQWVPAVEKVGVPYLHFHDLRHTGNTLAASTGASTRELMLRMGHASGRAALIYQHATRERDVAIADKISSLIEQTVRETQYGTAATQQGAP